ncbi:2-oxo-4-hydroxy-4-carboxy-5-ureidoimidazoline decarboxylase [Solihabitans fulvus]|uniref:2-oxo-4-hydroxy-4-carboxy-5-ureidoimidazoline decarboxylase n=1 Tax=Solihabitans fulvus TaxID=1892852 RepID=A0A5B2WNQ9_9PSEU|nr:2-oxo-4-hydroxy-4-carboxy-5-ureidoimidazoline decarboxylase [Solihabitans fulvus]KAA2253633.1 2-oxo-4-hydroxy-4-carboxy-5-ureidoimidazoline decarboxylase [Solihabitans fulvus]
MDELGLDGFNAAPAEDLAPLLAECLAVPHWVASVLAARPYSSVDDLLETADRAANELSPEEIESAIAGHPRIGERAKQPGVSASWSSAEQSGVDGRDASLAERLLAANVAYENHFGHIYLVCATGLSGEQMLADLAERMANDPASELRVVNRELGKIALLRLRRVVGA